MAQHLAKAFTQPGPWDTFPWERKHLAEMPAVSLNLSMDTTAFVTGSWVTMGYLRRDITFSV